MVESVSLRKWSEITRDLVITKIPFDYIYKANIILKDNKIWQIKSQEQFEELRKFLHIDFQNHEFPIKLDFNYRKLRKEVTKDIDLLFNAVFSNLEN